MSATEFIWIVDFASTACSLFFFTLGATFDLRTREVPNAVWLIYAPVGLMLTITRLAMEPSTRTATFISIASTFGVCLALYYFGLWGGADAKALICLALTLPIAPPIINSLTGHIVPFPITVLILGYFSSGSVVIWLGLRNLVGYSHERSEFFVGLKDEPWWKKALASVTGYPDSLTNLTKKIYLYPMEKVVEGTHGSVRRFHLGFDAESDRDQLVSKFIESLNRVGSPSRVWVNPGIPLLLFMLIGFVIALVVGDPIFSTVVMLATHSPT